jgi:hypothetical protein
MIYIKKDSLKEEIRKEKFRIFPAVLSEKDLKNLEYYSKKYKTTKTNLIRSALDYYFSKLKEMEEIEENAKNK